MSDAPERIWAWDETNCTDKNPHNKFTTEYIRADLAAAHIAALTAQVAQLSETYWLVRSFAVHDDSCELNKPPRFEGPCSCGLAKALSDGEAHTTLNNGGNDD